MLKYPTGTCHFFSVADYLFGCVYCQGVNFVADRVANKVQYNCQDHVETGSCREKKGEVVVLVIRE